MLPGARFRFLVAVLGLLALGVGLVFVFWPRSRLNVILVTLDTTRADHVGCYGYRAGLTPALDSLAESGVVFERAYAPVPLTLPSHASLLTGLYPPEHGLHDNGIGRLADDIPSLAEILSDRRYETAAFLSAFVLNSKFGLNRGFQTYDDDLSGTPQADSFSRRRRDGRSVMDAALDWLQHRGARPFFCWVHLFDAHAAYDVRQSQYGNRFLEQPYDAGIAAEDAQVWRLMAFLKKRGLADKTLLVVAGDHGEGLMEHGEQEHGWMLYEHAVHVPLIISGPECVKAGNRVRTPVSLVDVTPTVLDCLAVDQKVPMSGRSLKRSLLGDDPDPRPCYAETDRPYLEHWAAVARHHYQPLQVHPDALRGTLRFDRRSRRDAQPGGGRSEEARRAGCTARRNARKIRTARCRSGAAVHRRAAGSGEPWLHEW